MAYVKAIDGTVIKYPYNGRKELKQDHPTISFPLELSEELLAAFDIFLVEKTERPTSLTHIITEGDPIYENGTWKQNWVQTERSLEEIKNEYIDKINTDRDVKRNEAKFVYSANAYFNSDEISLTNIQATFNMALATKIANTPFEVNFTDANNVIHTFDADGAMTLGHEVFGQIDTIYTNARTYKDNILAANTANDIITIYTNYNNL